MKAILEPIIAVGIVVGLVLGSLNYFARAEQLVLDEMRLDQKIVADQVNQIQGRVWQLEDRNKGKPCADWQTQDEKDEYRKLQEQLKQLQERQKKLMK